MAFQGLQNAGRGIGLFPGWIDILDA